jgi:cohesin loading factor subunit SCC2
VSGNFRPSISLEEEGDTSRLHVRYAEICDTLNDGLVDASDLPSLVSIVSLPPSSVLTAGLFQTVINCIRTIHLFTAAYPKTLFASKASRLAFKLFEEFVFGESSLAPVVYQYVYYLLRTTRHNTYQTPKTELQYSPHTSPTLLNLFSNPRLISWYGDHRNQKS